MEGVYMGVFDEFSNIFHFDHDGRLGDFGNI